MMKVAYTSWTWMFAARDQKQALEQSFKELKYLGYDYVENFAFISDFYMENPQELVELTKKYDINLCNLYGHFTGEAEKDIETGKKQIDFLSAVGGKWFNCQHGGYGNEEPPEQPLNEELCGRICAIAEELGAYAKSKNVTLCFHSHYGTCVWDKEQIDYFFAHTTPENVAMCIDTAHVTLAGIDPAAMVREYGDRIAYVHLKDVDTCELAKVEGRAKMGTFRALGLGTVDFKGVYEALQEVGYDGVLCVELDNPAICNYNSAEISRKYIKNVLGL